MTIMLRRINIAAVLTLYASAACDPTLEAPLPLPSVDTSEAADSTMPPFELPPCLPSSLDFALAVDGNPPTTEDLDWHRPVWLQLHTAMQQQTLYQTTDSDWQAVTHTDIDVFIRWEVGIESAGRSGEPTQIELNVLSITSRPEQVVNTIDGLPVAGLSLVCRPSPRGAWVCRGRGEQGQLSDWPTALPNPLQFIAMQKRPSLMDNSAFSLDGIRLPANAQNRLRTGTIRDLPAHLLSWSADSTLATAWDAAADSTAAGHIAWTARSGRPFQLAACTSEQASGQSTLTAHMVRWSVNQSTHTSTSGYLTSVSRTSAQ